MSSKKPQPQLFFTLSDKGREKRRGTNWSLERGRKGGERGSNYPTGKYTLAENL